MTTLELTNENLDKSQEIALEELKTRNLSMDELIEFIKSKNYSEPIARELFWRLSEYGLAKINSDWDLEII
jgi:hypothetical protein